MFKTSIQPKDGPKALGPYSPGIKLGDFIYLSGQLGLDPVTSALIGDDIASQTRQALENVKAILKRTNLEMRHIVKTTVYLTDMSLFAEMNEVYGEFFQKPYPARTTIAVKELPAKALVEIECLAIDTLVYEEQAISRLRDADDMAGPSNEGCCGSSSGGGCCSRK